MKHSLFFALILTVASPQIIHAKSVNSEFSTAWSDRILRYNSDVSAKKVALQSVIARMNNPDVPPPDRSDQVVNVYLEASEDFGYSQGRLIALKTFISFFKSKPSPARSELWMQDRQDEIREYTKTVKSKLEEIGLILDKNDPENAKKILDILSEHAFMDGMNKGMIDEFKLIDQNLATFYNARQAERERNAAAWGAAAEALSKVGKSYQPVSPLPPLIVPKTTTTTNCHTIGQNTTCTTM